MTCQELATKVVVNLTATKLPMAARRVHARRFVISTPRHRPGLQRVRHPQHAPKECLKKLRLPPLTVQMLLRLLQEMLRVRLRLRPLLVPTQQPWLACVA